MHAEQRTETSRTSPPPVALRAPQQSRDYSGHLARLIVLVATFGTGYLLNYFASGRPYFGFLVLSGVVLLCLGLVLGPQMQLRSARIAVPLFDLAWITFAMYLTHGLSSFILPLLYIVVAMAAMRGDHWEVGMSLAGAITGIFLLASADRTEPLISLAVAQATLLAAAALAVRLTAAIGRDRAERDDVNSALYETLFEKTSDAVMTLNPEDWTILKANPAAREQFSMGADETDRLDHVLDFNDRAFLRTCRERLEREEPVWDGATYAILRSGRKVALRCHLTPLQEPSMGRVIQAIIEVTDEEEAAAPSRALPRDDFSLNYIPSLTHELNNHLAAIRLSAELAATTGKVPDFQEMQQQVDRCQDVLQTVVLQILRSAAPVTTPEQVPSSNLRTVVERCLLLTRPQVLTNGIQLRVDVPAELPNVSGFAHELQEAFVRVMIYSVKIMADQPSPRAVTLSVTPRERQVDVLVSDTGPGLGMWELAVIGGKQNIVSRAEDRGWEMVRDAVCRFGGQVQATNGLHGGMRFKMTLPVHQE